MVGTQAQTIRNTNNSAVLTIDDKGVVSGYTEVTIVDEGENIEAIKADTEALEKAFYPIAEKMYREEAAKNGGSSAGDPGAGAGPEQGPDGNTYYSSDFEDKSGN